MWLIGIKSIPFRYWMCSWMVSNPPTLAPVKYSNQTENFLILSRILEWYSCTNIHHTYNIVFGRAGGKLCITRIVGHRSQSPPFVPPWPTIVCPKVRALSGLIWLWLLYYTSRLGNVQVLHKHFWGEGVWPGWEFSGRGSKNLARKSWILKQGFEKKLRNFVEILIYDKESCSFVETFHQKDKISQIFFCQEKDNPPP